MYHNNISVKIFIIEEEQQDFCLNMIMTEICYDIPKIKQHTCISNSH